MKHFFWTQILQFWNSCPPWKVSPPWKISWLRHCLRGWYYGPPPPILEGRARPAVPTPLLYWRIPLYLIAIIYFDDLFSDGRKKTKKKKWGKSGGHWQESSTESVSGWRCWLSPECAALSSLAPYRRPSWKILLYLRNVLLSLLWLHIGSHLEKSGVWTFTHPPGGECGTVVAALC